MGSSNVKAQKLANEANVQMTRETNQANKDIAESANQWNWANLQAQNQWNIDQWNRENEYNDPSEQMARLMRAGINPLWNNGNGVTPGEAQHLESGQAAPAEVATMQAPRVLPEVDPNFNSNLIGALQNVSNSSMGFARLALESEDVRTRSAAQRSQEALNRAEAMYKRSQTEGQNIFNNLNTRTFETQVSSKAAEYTRLQSEIKEIESRTSKNAADEALLKSLKENAAAQYDQIIAQTNYVKTQSEAILEQLRQGWRRLAIDQQNANTNAFSSGSQSYYQGEELKLKAREQSFNEGAIIEQLSSKSTDQLLALLREQEGYLGKFVPGLDRVTSGAADWLLGEDDTAGRINMAITYTSHIGDVLEQRVKSDPSVYNIKSYQDYLNTLSDMPFPSAKIDTQNFQMNSVLNPSGLP